MVEFSAKLSGKPGVEFDSDQMSSALGKKSCKHSPPWPNLDYGRMAGVA
jgi:hypothetical protein